MQSIRFCIRQVRGGEFVVRYCLTYEVLELALERPIMSLFIKLWELLAPKQRRGAVALLSLMLIGNESWMDAHMSRRCSL